MTEETRGQLHRDAISPSGGKTSVEAAKENDLLTFESEPAAWQWRYEGTKEWKTPPGGRKLTGETLKRERRPIEQRPLYAIQKQGGL